jgi:RimJ/RimL family protein N-acetyltransferase
MPPPTIKTPHYTLRPFKKEDALLWQNWDTDSETQVHMPGPLNQPQTIEEQYRYIEECEADEEGYYWSIETRDQVTIGTVSLTSINTHHKVAELGIVIGDKDYWGKGVATEVISELVRHAFDNLEIKYISAEVEVPNLPMQKVFEKVGFKQDGLFEKARVKGEGRVDVLHFGKHLYNTNYRSYVTSKTNSKKLW